MFVLGAGETEIVLWSFLRVQVLWDQDIVDDWHVDRFLNNPGFFCRCVEMSGIGPLALVLLAKPGISFIFPLMACTVGSLMGSNISLLGLCARNGADSPQPFTNLALVNPVFDSIGASDPIASCLVERAHGDRVDAVFVDVGPGGVAVGVFAEGGGLSDVLGLVHAQN